MKNLSSCLAIVIVLPSIMMPKAEEVEYPSMDNIAEMIWVGQYLHEDIVKLVERIPAIEISELLSAVYRSSHYNPEGAGVVLDIVLSEFGKRVTTPKWRILMERILVCDEMPKHLKMDIASAGQYQLEIVGDDIETIIKTRNDLIDHADEVWVAAQSGIARALRISHATAVRESKSEEISQIKELAEKQLRSVLAGLIIVGTGDASIYRSYTVGTLIVYRDIMQRAFEDELSGAFLKSCIDASKELLILEDIYRNPRYNPSVSGPVLSRVRVLKKMAELQQIDLTEEDQRRIRVILPPE